MNFKTSFALETEASLHTNFDFFATRVASWYGFLVSIRILFVRVLLFPSDFEDAVTPAGDDDETCRTVVLALDDRKQHLRHNARLYRPNIEMNFDALESQEQNL